MLSQYACFPEMDLAPSPYDTTLSVCCTDGLPNVMMGVMQIQMVAGQDPTVAEGVALLSQCVSGNIPSDEAVAAYAQKL